jgi:hypothetical protein
MERPYNYRDGRYFKRPALRPRIDPKCWTDADLEFWLTGDYDMSQESPDVQIMLDMASMLTDARVEWLMAGSRAQQHETPSSGDNYTPRHCGSTALQRRGYGIGRSDD